MMRVGVTGNYASGKGTVCEIFRALGAEVIDTDIISRDIVKPGMPGLDMIKNSFGDNYLQPDGTLDRKKFGKFVFSNAQNVDILNAIMHPLIKDITINLSSDESIIYMINAPVLFEAGFNTFMDKIIIVSADKEQSIARGEKRDGLSQTEIIERLSHQILLKEKIKNADYIIDNSGTIENTRKQAEEIWNNLKISSQKMHK